MKQIDISRSVMDKVIRYESTQTVRWLTAFFIALAIIAGGLLYLVWAMYSTGTSMRTWDLVGLFVEDTMTITEFWQDTLSVVLYEISPIAILLLLFLILAVIVLLSRTSKKRRIIRRVRTELAKRQKNRNNMPYGKETT